MEMAAMNVKSAVRAMLMHVLYTIVRTPTQYGAWKGGTRETVYYMVAAENAGNRALLACLAVFIRATAPWFGVHWRFVRLLDIYGMLVHVA
jgi:hypothetical protein